MKCKLCDSDKKLVRAHIIPDFLYEGMFNEQHKIICTTIEKFSTKSTLPTGIYDKEILCEECDNVIISIVGEATLLACTQHQQGRKFSRASNLHAIWFCVTSFIEQVVQMIISGEIVKYRYDGVREEIITR